MQKTDIEELTKSILDKDLEHILPHLTNRQKHTLLMMALKFDEENTQQKAKNNN